VGDGPPGQSHPAATTTEPQPSEAGSAEKTSHERGTRSSLRELALLTGIALVIAILIKAFVVQAFYIPSESMVPTLFRGDRVLVNRLAYRLGDIDRGDIVVFSDPMPGAGEDRGLVDGLLHWLGEGLGVARPDDDDFIKRVIALPGETWEIRRGVTYVDGTKLAEPYLNPLLPDTGSYGPAAVPDGMLFVMGDNRLESGDSRFDPPRGVGYVPIDRVIGRAFVVIWPPSRMGWLH
jgi:signal peptidase I